MLPDNPGPGHVKGPNRQKLDTYLAGAWPQDILTVLNQWKKAHTRLTDTRSVLLTQKKRLESGDGGLSETSPTVVTAAATFNQGASDLETKAGQVHDAMTKLQLVHDAVQAALTWASQADQKLPTQHGPAPSRSDYDDRMGKPKDYDPQKAYEKDKTAWDKQQTAISTNDAEALQHIQTLDRVFGDASDSVKKVTDAPAPTSSGGGGGDATPPGSTTPSYTPPPATTVPTANHTPHYTRPPSYTPPPSDGQQPHDDPPPAYDPPRYDPPPAYTPPNDDGTLDGGVPSPTGPGYTPSTYPTPTGVPTPGVTPGLPAGVPTGAASPVAPALPIGLGGLTAGALGGARPNLTVPEVGLGTTARAAGPGVLGGEGARAGGARAGGMGTSARSGGRGGVRSGAGSQGSRGGRRAGGAGGRGGRKDKERRGEEDLWDDGSDWLDDEASGPSVLH